MDLFKGLSAQQFADKATDNSIRKESVFLIVPWALAAVVPALY